MPDDAAPLTDDEVAAWRERFPTLRRCTYLINNSLGAMPGTVPESLATFARLWEEKGVEAWHTDWLPEVAAVANLLADLLHAPHGSVVVHQNVATLTSMVFSTVDFRADRDAILLCDVDWPSHHYLAQMHGRVGARVDVVASQDGVPDVDAVCAAINERTAIVVVSHVLFRTSAIMDVARVAAAARRAGALCLVDGYHALGHMPVDVGAIGCDFYVGGSVKWLCGGPGVGYLYVAPDRDLPPLREVGWLGHARPFAFDTGWEPADGAMGWLGGTPSMPALYSAREGYRCIAEVTPARIRATSRRLTARLVEGALDRGVEVLTPLDADARAGAVTMFLGDDTEQISRRLIDAGVIVDFRPGSGIRVGPHFFNTLDECDLLLDRLQT